MLVDHPRRRAAKKLTKNAKQNEPRPTGRTRLDNVAADGFNLLEANMKQSHARNKPA
jgi:hypothetical protein